jgi:adenosylhomocysteine nucleosidase
MRILDLALFAQLLSACAHGLPAAQPARTPASVGIIAALPEEIAHLRRRLSGLTSEDEMLIGRLGARRVVVALSGVGKVNAAATTQKLVSDHHVRCVLFSGVSGRLNPDLGVGDVIVATRVFQHDFGFVGPDGLVRHRPGRLPELGLGGNENEELAVALDPFWNGGGGRFPEYVARLARAQESRLAALEIGGKRRAARVVTGTVATGDQFIAAVEKQKELRALGADVVEMEGAAVVQVAHRNRIPVLVIRSVSDAADQGAPVDFPTFAEAAANNNTVVIETIFGDQAFLASCPA